MDWNAVSAIADVLAAISVILTVVYLAIQIRKNTHATHSQTYQLATSALAEMAGIIGSSKELARSNCTYKQSAHAFGLTIKLKKRLPSTWASSRTLASSTRSTALKARPALRDPC